MPAEGSTAAIASGSGASGLRPSIGQVISLLAALPVAVTASFHPRVAALRSILNQVPDRGPDDPVPDAGIPHLSDLIAMAMLLPLLQRGDDERSRIGDLLRTVVGSSAALGHLVLGRILGDRKMWREAPPTRFVVWESGLLWLPDGLLDLVKQHGDPQFFTLTDRTRWIIDPCFPVPLRQRAIVQRQGMVVDRRTGLQRRVLVASSLDDLRLKASQWAKPWADESLEMADILQIAAFDRFAASCILLNRSSRPIEGWLELASHARAGIQAPKAVDRVVATLGGVELGIPPHAAFALSRGVRFLFRSQGDPISDFTTTWWRIRGFFLDSLQEQERIMSRFGDGSGVAGDHPNATTDRRERHV